MAIKAIIFDMDGTIIDTEHIWEEATRCLIESKGVAYTPELHAELQKSIRGLAMPKSIYLIKDLAQLEDSAEELMHQKSCIADALYRKGIRFIEGFEEFHSKVKKQNLHSAIATNALDMTVTITNEALDLKRFFGEHIYNISHVNNICKPHPALYLHAARQLGFEPQECIAIEDSAHGITAAQNAGMFCIGINSAGNRKNIEKADLTIEGYGDLSLEELIARKCRTT